MPGEPLTRNSSVISNEPLELPWRSTAYGGAASGTADLSDSSVIASTASSLLANAGSVVESDESALRPSIVTDEDPSFESVENASSAAAVIARLRKLTCVAVLFCTSTPCRVGVAMAAWLIVTSAELLLATWMAAGAAELTSVIENGADATRVVLRATGVSSVADVLLTCTSPPVRFCTRMLSSLDAVVAILPWNVTSAAPPLIQSPRPRFVTFMFSRLTCWLPGRFVNWTAVCPGPVTICTSLTFAPAVSVASATMAAGAFSIRR